MTVRKKAAFRQFHIGGFVNQYLLDKIAEDGQTISFVTSLENISLLKAKESDDP
jgi:hypothetical protein